MIYDKEPKYFVINADENGDVNLYQFTKEELEKGLNEGDFGDIKIHKDGDSLDLDYNPRMIIIRGEIIVPKAVTKTIKFEV